MKQKRMQENDILVSAPKVSILIPVYNVEKFVERCLLSVLGQTMQEDVEVIILNDCTPDRSMEIIQDVLSSHLKEDGMTVHIIEHERNRGLAAARNTLISQASGEYVWHIDSDDYVDSDMLEKMYSKAMETGADIVMTDVLFEESPVAQKIKKAPYYLEKEKILGCIIRGENNCLWNKLIRRSLYVEYGISATEGMDMAEDYGVILPLCYAAKKIEYVSGVFYHYVQYNALALTMCRVTQRVIDEHLYYVKKMEVFFLEKKIEGYDLDFVYSKMGMKIRYMKYTTGKMLQKCAHLFPEITPYKKELLRLSLGRTDRILTFLVLSGYPRLFKFFLKIASLLGKKFV